MLDDIEPYSNGYKLVLSIGNPYYAVFSGMKTRARWGSAFETEASEKDMSAYEAWEKTFKEKEETVTHELRPGTWNKITVIRPGKARGPRIRRVLNDGGAGKTR